MVEAPLRIRMRTAIRQHSLTPEKERQDTDCNPAGRARNFPKSIASRHSWSRTAFCSNLRISLSLRWDQNRFAHAMQKLFVRRSDCGQCTA
jgi:hypothetical protein